MDAWQVVLAGVLTVAGSAWAARIAGRSSVEVAQVSARVDQQTVEVDAQRAATERFQAVHAADAARISELAARVEALERENERHRQREDAWRDAAQAHVSWDWRAERVVDRLKALPGAPQVELGDPPPLIPRMVA